MNYKRLFISLALPQLAGLVGSLFTVEAISGWYLTLEKPFFNPPNWLFGPVWLLLYLLMGISIYLIWQKGLAQKRVKVAFILFWIHLFFNATWSLIFFGLKNPGLALVNIALIWLFILILMFRFWVLDRRASWLLLPYFLWVSFASLLNYSIWVLN